RERRQRLTGRSIEGVVNDLVIGFGGDLGFGGRAFRRLGGYLPLDFRRLSGQVRSRSTPTRGNQARLAVRHTAHHSHHSLPGRAAPHGSHHSARCHLVVDDTGCRGSGAGRHTDPLGSLDLRPVPAPSPGHGLESPLSSSLIGGSLSSSLVGTT